MSESSKFWIFGTLALSALIGAGSAYLTCQLLPTNEVAHQKILSENVRLSNALAKTDAELARYKSNEAHSASSSQKALEDIEAKIQRQEAIVESYRNRLLKFSQEKGIIYFDRQPSPASDSENSAESTSSNTAADYTLFVTYKRDYEDAIETLNTLKASTVLKELYEHVQ